MGWRCSLSLVADVVCLEVEEKFWFDGRSRINVEAGRTDPPATLLTTRPRYTAWSYGKLQGRVFIHLKRYKEATDRFLQFHRPVATPARTYKPRWPVSNQSTRRTCRRAASASDPLQRPPLTMRRTEMPWFCHVLMLTICLTSDEVNMSIDVVGVCSLLSGWGGRQGPHFGRLIFALVACGRSRKGLIPASYQTRLTTSPSC